MGIVIKLYFDWSDDEYGESYEIVSKNHGVLLFHEAEKKGLIKILKCVRRGYLKHYLYVEILKPKEIKGLRADYGLNGIWFIPIYKAIQKFKVKRKPKNA